MRRRPRTSAEPTPADRAGQRRSLEASRTPSPPSRTRKAPVKAEGRAHADAEQLRVLPSQLRPGDLVADDQGELWEVSRPSSVYQAGKMHTVKMQKSGDPTTVWQNVWPAHIRIAIRRPRHPPSALGDGGAARLEHPQVQNRQQPQRAGGPPSPDGTTARSGRTDWNGTQSRHPGYLKRERPTRHRGWRGTGVEQIRRASQKG
jgi:hypothetical protein